MAFTDDEKVRIRHHLGYLNVAEAYTFVLGVPAAQQTQFMIEGAMDRVLVVAESQVRKHIEILDKIEAQMVDDLELLSVEQAGEITIRRDEQSALKREYLYWRDSLANIFGTIPNPHDNRFAVGAAGINVPVIH